MFWTNYPFTSFDLDAVSPPRSPVSGDAPDFVGTLEHVKQLFRVLYDDAADIEGITLHRLGQTLVFDDTPKASLKHPHRPLLVPSDELCTSSGYVGAFGQAKVKNTFLEVCQERADSPLARTVSAPAGSGRWHDNSELENQLSGQRVSRVSGPYQKLLFRPSLGSVPEYFSEEEDDSNDINCSLALNSQARIRATPTDKSVRWDLGDFSLYLCCDLLLVGADNQTSGGLVSLKKLGNHSSPTKAQLSDAWVENSVLSVPRVAWERNGELSVASTSNLLSRDIEDLLERVRKLLAFLKTSCSEQGGVYYFGKDLIRTGECQEVGVFTSPTNSVIPNAKHLLFPMARLCLSLSQRSDMAKADRCQLVHKGLDLARASLGDREDYHLFIERRAVFTSLALELSAISDTPSREVLEALFEAEGMFQDDQGEELVTRVSVALAEMLLQLAREPSDQSTSLRVLQLAIVYLLAVPEPRRKVECGRLEARLLLEAAEQYHRLGSHKRSSTPGPVSYETSIDLRQKLYGASTDFQVLERFCCDIIQESPYETIRYLSIAASAVHRAASLSDEPDRSFEKLLAIKVDQAEFWFKKGMQKADLNLMTCGRHILIEAASSIRDNGISKARTFALAKNLKGCAALVAHQEGLSGLWYRLRATGLDLVESGDTAVAAGEHLAIAKDLLSLKLDEKLGKSSTLDGVLTKDIGSIREKLGKRVASEPEGTVRLLATQHLQSALSFAEANLVPAQVSAAVHLELAKLYGLERSQNEQKYTLAIRHAEKAWTQYYREQKEGFEESLTVYASLLSGKDVVASISLIKEGELRRPGVFIALACNISKLMLKELPTYSKIRAGLKGVYAAALQASESFQKAAGLFLSCS